MTRRSPLLSLIDDFVRFAGARLWLAGGLMALGAAAEGFGLLMVVPLAAAATGQDSALPAWLSDILAATFPGSRFTAALALFLIAMTARSVILYARDVVRARLQADYQASLQLRSAATLAGRGWRDAGRLGQGEMQSLLLNDVPRAALAIVLALEVGLSVILLIVQLGLVAMLSPQLALIGIVVLAPLFIGLKLLAPRLATSGQEISAESERSTGAGQRLQAGLKAALAQGTVPQFLAEYRASLSRLAGTTIRFARALALSRQMTALASAVAAALLLVVGAQLLELPFPTLAAALVLFARMAAPATSLVQSAQSAVAAAPAFAAIERRLGPLARADPPAAQPAEALDWSMVELRGATYRHDSGGGVGEADLSISRGEWVGVDGASAAGKTTLADLVCGLLAPQSGAASVDGEPLAGATLDRWRAGIAYVGQDGLVFDDSIAANLAADRGQVSDDECWRVLEDVGLADRVRALPDGLAHPLGQYGGSLSGGERQRLLIARALLRDPSFIILDEATAALDAAAEARLIDRLRALPSRPAAIVIAHRDSTLAHCDSRIAIQHGKLQRGKTRR